MSPGGETGVLVAFDREDFSQAQRSRLTDAAVVQPARDLLAMDRETRPALGGRVVHARGLRELERATAPAGVPQRAGQREARAGTEVRIGAIAIVVGDRALEVRQGERRRARAALRVAEPTVDQRARLQIAGVIEREERPLAQRDRARLALALVGDAGPQVERAGQEAPRLAPRMAGLLDRGVGDRGRTVEIGESLVGEREVVGTVMRESWSLPYTVSITASASSYMPDRGAESSVSSAIEARPCSGNTRCG